MKKTRLLFFRHVDLRMLLEGMVKARCATFAGPQNEKIWGDKASFPGNLRPIDTAHDRTIRSFPKVLQEGTWSPLTPGNPNAEKRDIRRSDSADAGGLAEGFGAYF